jgi:hypothetical protein
VVRESFLVVGRGTSYAADYWLDVAYDDYPQEALVMVCAAATETESLRSKIIIISVAVCAAALETGPTRFTAILDSISDYM